MTYQPDPYIPAVYSLPNITIGVQNFRDSQNGLYLNGAFVTYFNSAPGTYDWQQPNYTVLTITNEQTGSTYTLNVGRYEISTLGYVIYTPPYTELPYFVISTADPPTYRGNPYHVLDEEVLSTIVPIQAFNVYSGTDTFIANINNPGVPSGALFTLKGNGTPNQAIQWNSNVASGPYYIVVNGVGELNYTPQIFDYDLTKLKFPPPTVSVDSTVVTESVSGALATFVVSLSTASQDTITVQYTTQDQTAKAGTDYTAKSGLLTFSPGQTSQTIDVPILSDKSTQQFETFAVVLSNPIDEGGGSAPTLSASVGTGTIVSAPSSDLLLKVQAIDTYLQSVPATAGYATNREFAVVQALAIALQTADSGTTLADLIHSSEQLIQNDISNPVQQQFNADDLAYLEGIELGINNDTLAYALQVIVSSIGELFGSGGYGISGDITDGYNAGRNLRAVTTVTKYWTGSQWILQDGSTTTAPSTVDTGILGGTLTGATLPQSGIVPFFGLTVSHIGVLSVVGIGPWTVAGTGGVGDTIDSLIVDMGASVTVQSPVAIKSVVIQQVPGVTMPANVYIADGLPPGAVIDFPNGVVSYSTGFDGTSTKVTVDSANGTVANITIPGKVTFSGAPVSDGSGGTEIVVTGTQPYTIAPDLILDVRSANDINRGTGESIIMGNTDVQPNAYQGTTLIASAIINPATGLPYRVVSVPFGGSPALPNEFHSRLSYDPTNSADAYKIQPWTLSYTNGASTLITTTPSLAGVTPPPFASKVTFSGSSTNPTFTWSYPSGSVNGVFFDIFDDAAVNATGSALLVYSATIVGNVGSFTVPNALAGGLTLQQGHHYTLDLFGVVTRDGTNTLTDPNSAAWSESYFDFEPITGASVPTVYLPMIINGAYNFNNPVVPGQTYFYDPAVATGYAYATGAGNPSFASVLLPAIQTTPFLVTFLNNGIQETDTVAPNTVFSFPTGGVSMFTVSGIDPAEDLDPTNTTAFVTGLTFVSSGVFTGTQTPLIDTGPTAGNRAVTEGHGQTVSLTALINGLVMPGIVGDTETLTNVIAALGTAVLGSSNVVTYTAPVIGPDTISYTVADQHGDTATGEVAITVDLGPSISAVIPLVVEMGQTTEIGIVAPGIPGDALTLKQTGGSGTVALQLVSGVEEVIYTAPASPPASTTDSVSYTITDQYGDIATGQMAVTVDPGPSITVVTPSAVEKTQTTAIGTVTPGLTGDTLTLKQTGGSLGTLSLGPVQANGTRQVIYTAPATVSASAIDKVAYTIVDQHNDVMASGSASVQLDAGPSITLLPFAPGPANKAITVAIATPGLPADMLSLVVTQAPQSGTLVLNGAFVQFTPGSSNLSNFLKPITFSFEIKDELGGVTLTNTVIVGGDLANNVTGSASGNTDISLGNGLNKVTVAGNGNVVDAGNGATIISGGVSNNTIILGSGIDSVTLSGGNNKVTLGNGVDSVKLSGGSNMVTLGNGIDSISVGGSGNQINLGSGIDVVHGGTGDIISLKNTNLTLYGNNEMVFTGGGNATVNDFSVGLRLMIGPTAGNDILAHFASDPSAVIDLIGGIGGFKIAAAVVSALKSDGHGGASLSFGHGSSLDFTGVTPSQLHAANFQIG